MNRAPIIVTLMLFSTYLFSQQLRAKIYAIDYYTMPEASIPERILLQHKSTDYFGQELIELKKCLKTIKGIKSEDDWIDARLLIDVYIKNRKQFRICFGAWGEYKYHGKYYNQNLKLNEIVERITGKKFIISTAPLHPQQ